MSIEITHSNGTFARLTCPYRVLRALLGPPYRYSPEQTDGKVQAEWDQNVPDLGKVNIYDYKEDVPVEQVETWSFKALPAVAKALVEQLNQQAALMESPKDHPTLQDLFDVRDWTEFTADALTRKERSLKFEGVEGYPAWFGHVKFWFVYRFELKGSMHARFYDCDTKQVVAAFVTNG